MGEVIAEAEVKAEAESGDTVAQEAPQTPHVAPQAPTPSKASPKKKPPTATKAKGTREGSKTEIVVGLLNRAGGVTLAELMEATGWQAHSVRGFIAGIARKRMGLNVVSEKRESGERVYSVEK